MAPTNSDRNAAIWYALDGYSPESKGINGRRVAGQSFLKGFLKHAQTDEFVSITESNEEQSSFEDLKNAHNPTIKHRGVFSWDLQKMPPVRTIYYPAPNFDSLAWRRQSLGIAHHSICGITHTTATQAVMRGIIDTRSGPQAPWDGLICTSKAVHAATSRNMDFADEFLNDRFGSVPHRPQMPIIPLGINAEEHAFDPKAGSALRKRMQWDSSDIAVCTISRLLPYGKFDPGPLFIALQQAQEALGKERRLHYIACGIYADTHSEVVFNDLAKALMPDVSYHHLPGDDPVARKETLSASDIFAFPIDNIQETFGLAPIEAMAAGLPVVVSDWDGMRDTVTSDVGFRATTSMARAQATSPEAIGYLNGSFSYGQYGNRLSMLTDVSIKEMKDAFVKLARNDDLRRAMGEAGKRRVKTEYDWSVIIPKMQDFWAELENIRKSYAEKYTFKRTNPVGPLPGDLFNSYPTAPYDRSEKYHRFTSSLTQLEQIYSLRRFDQIMKPAESLSTLNKVAQALIAHGSEGANSVQLVKELGWNPYTIERSLLFFCKYGLAELIEPEPTEPSSS